MVRLRKVNLDYCRSLLEDETRHVLTYCMGHPSPALVYPMHLHLQLLDYGLPEKETSSLKADG